MAGTPFASLPARRFVAIWVLRNWATMSTDSFWISVDVLAAAFEGSREAAEQAIARLEREVIARPRAERDELRRKIIVIVAGMSRLEVRLLSTDGPSHAAV
jgi:hypothetical protein